MIDNLILYELLDAYYRVQNGFDLNASDTSIDIEVWRIYASGVIDGDGDPVDEIRIVFKYVGPYDVGGGWMRNDGGRYQADICVKKRIIRMYKLEKILKNDE